jgi:hypothetical protein
MGSTVTGAWAEQARLIYDGSVRNCDVCGTIIPARIWCFHDTGREVRACSPACETLYFEYWAPRYLEFGVREHRGCGSASPADAPPTRRSNGDRQ